jgi:hypothetical protein
MKKYSILYAEEVPHYTAHEIQAENDAQAVELAKAFDWFGLPSDPDHHSAVLRRIVYIEDGAASEIVDENIPLDNWFLREGDEKRQALYDAAADMLEALRLCEEVLSGLARTDDGTPSVSALHMARDVIAKAEDGR